MSSSRSLSPESAVKRGEARPAPGRSQHREPRGAVGEVVQGARELHEIAHHHALAQRHEVDPERRHTLRLERIDDRHRVRVGGDQDRHARVPVETAQLGDARGDRPRLPGPIMRKEPERHGRDGGKRSFGGTRRRAGAVAHRARAQVIHRWQDLREEFVGNIHQCRDRPEVADEAQGLQLQLPDARARAP